MIQHQRGQSELASLAQDPTAALEKRSAMRKQLPVWRRRRRVEKTKEKVEDLIHTVAETGTNRDTMDGDIDD